MRQESAARQQEDTLRIPSVQPVLQHSPIDEVFRKVEQGIKISAVNEFEKELGAMVSVTIGTSEHGYYSVNQAASVLSGYFSGRRPLSFEFSRIHKKDSAPYATGRFIYVQKGIQESAQIYISLIQQDSTWVINQFNIY